MKKSILIAIHYLINLTVIVITAVYFIQKIAALNLVNNININRYYILIIFIIIMILIIKYVRIVSIMMYGNINTERIIKTYIKTVFVLIFFPFKLGELYRIYAFSREYGSLSKGIFTVIIDRFFDLLGLLVVYYFIYILNNGIIFNDYLINMLLIICMIVILIYFSFARTITVYKRYIITNIHSKNIIPVLKYIYILNNMYIYISNIIKDRGMFLFILSIIAWILEYVALNITVNELGYESIYPSSKYVNMLFYGNDIPYHVYTTIQFTVIFFIFLCIYFYYNILRKIK